MKAFGIFEGGGAKGFAHIGALKAAETRRVKFVGVAGASAGSIVAALVAAGYKADDLFNPKESLGNRGILDKDFLDFLSRDGWQNLQTIKSDLEGLITDEIPRSTVKRLVRKVSRHFKSTAFVGKWKDAHLICYRNRAVLMEVWRERGLFYDGTVRGVVGR